MSELLLTHEEQLAKLEELFGSYENKGKCFEPTVGFYDLLANEEGLSVAAKQLYQWLGLKPYRVHISYADTTPESPSTIHLPTYYVDKPYEAGALLAVAVLRHVLTQRKHYEPDELFLEFASVHCGFGIVVLNGIVTDKDCLGYSAADYAETLLEYAQVYQGDLSLHIAAMTPPTQELLTSALHLKHHHIAVPKVVIRQQRMKAAKRFKLGLGLTGVAIVFGTASFVWLQRPSKISEAASLQYQKALALRQEHGNCAKEAQTMQNTYDLNDIFMQRQVDAKLVECLSLKNQYNYEVDQYKKLTEE